MSATDQSEAGGRGIRLPRILGIEVRLDYSWFIIFGLVLWTLAAHYFPQTYPGREAGVYWAMAFVSALLLFASVLAHELSHAVVARTQGVPVPRITLFIFGGMAHISREPPGPQAEFRIAAVGPLSSLVLAGLFFGLQQVLAAYSDIAARTAYYLALANLILAVFNLFPGFPLDGGRVLRAWLWHRWQDLRRATRTVTTIGRSFGTGLMLLGLLGLLAGDLLGGLWMIFIGLFLRQAAEGSYQITALKESLRGVSVADIMQRDPVSVSPDLTLEELVRDFFYRHRFTSFPVTRDARLHGLIHINQVKEIPQDRWAATRVNEVMSPVEKLPTAQPDEEAFEAFQRMSRRGRQKLTVVKDGRLAGILTAQDILELFRIRSDLGA